jgi:putative iron-regulated protein
MNNTLFRTAMMALAFVAATPAIAQTATPQTVVENYAAIVLATYEDTLAATKKMQKAIDAFLAKPSAATQKAAKDAWLAAREFYGQTEAFRFYGGPIDGADGPEARINSWPVDESYIDYVKDKPNSGIVNNPKIKINAKQLAAMNTRGGEENIATGWHAIEFLLWGQDFNDKGPGDRSFNDYVDGKQPNAKRRREYLKVVTALLVDDLETVTKAWQPKGKNYRARFVGNPSEALRRIFVGIGSLSRGEMAGERLEVPLASQDQEDEQSCFSDNTHRDLVNDAIGIENVWLGRYARAEGGTLKGPSLADLVAAKNAEQAKQTTTAVAAAVAAVKAIHPPFDQEIRGDAKAPGRVRVQAAIEALKTQTKELVASAAAIGITKLTMVNPKSK